MTILLLSIILKIDELTTHSLRFKTTETKAKSFRIKNGWLKKIADFLFQRVNLKTHFLLNSFQILLEKIKKWLNFLDLKLYC